MIMILQMIPAAVGASLIQGAANFGQSWMQGRQQRRNIRDTHRMNRQLAEDAHARDVELWERQMEYNSPAQQMERFREAGLSPHLMYGQGTPGNVMTHPTMSYQPADFTGRPPPFDIGATVQGLHQGVMQSHDRRIVDQKLSQEVNQTWISGYNRQLKEIEAVDASRANELSSLLHGVLMTNPQATVKQLHDNWVARMTAQEKNNSRTVLLSDFQKEVNRLASVNMQLGDHMKLRAMEMALRALGVAVPELNSILENLE